MYQVVKDSLHRQGKALGVLRELIEEEYGYLLKHDTDSVAHIEFSIQELIRQLALEKACVIRTLGGMRVREYALALSEEQAEVIETLYNIIDDGEQDTARLASRNAELAMAFVSQSNRMLHGLTDQVIKEKSEVYGRKGYMRMGVHPEASLISGRL